MSTSQPWHDWPTDLPQCNAPVDAKLQEQYTMINDYTFHRQLCTEQRQRLITTFHSPQHKLNISDSIVLLQGGTSVDWELYDTDIEKSTFRQESFFRYLFMINEPDCYGMINLTTKRTALFIPYIPDDHQRWSGERKPLEWYSERYGCDEAYHVEQLNDTLQQQMIKTIYRLHGTNSDSGISTRTTATFKGVDQYQCDDKLLYKLLEDQRVIKTDNEIKLLRLANLISSQAHVYVMRHIQPSTYELQLEMLYKSYTGYYGGARHVAYTCICGSGHNGATLHYGHAGAPNDKLLQDNDMCVLDMGAEYIGYATDITRSYPVNGKFTPDQRAIHDVVHDAQQAVLKALKPGINYSDMHTLAESVLLKHLHKIGILQGGSIEEYTAVYMAAVFQPHGLGHLVGLNVHDVGGIDRDSQRAQTPGLAYLRLNKVLEAGMLLTVEPGLYFVDYLLDKALNNPAQAKYINNDVLSRFRKFGGVRIEDDVLITADGCENLTVAPSSADEIEEVFRRRHQ